MAVLVTDLATAVRVDSPDAEETAVLTGWLDAAKELITARAPGAPEKVADGATLRLAGYWYDQPTATRSSGFANAMTNSGALAMLGPWVVRRVAGAVDDIEPDPGPALRLLGWSVDETIDAEDLAAAGIEGFEDALPIPQFAIDNAYLWAATWLSDLPTSVGNSAGPLPRRDDVTYNGLNGRYSGLPN